MKKKLYSNFIPYLAICLLFFILQVKTLAVDLTSTSFIIRDPVIGAGGGYGSSSAFQLFGSEDTLFTGAGSSASFLGRYGFLYFSDSVTPTPSSSSGGGGEGAGIINPYCKIADFNCDKYVNIFDLSILLYYVERPGPAVSEYDLSNDSEVGFTDISIVFYYWDTDSDI